MKVSELIKYLKFEDPNSNVILTDDGIAVVDPIHIPRRIKQALRLPRKIKGISKIEDVQPLEYYDRGDVAYAGRNEIHKIYEKMGLDWENRFNYVLSFNFGKNWCHLFLDFRESRDISNENLWFIERRGYLGGDLVKVPATKGWVPENGQQSILEYEQSFGSNIIMIPERFRDVKYKGSRIPGVENQENLLLGANCQLYIYEFLKEYNKELPNFRSRELWEDTVYTEKVEGDLLPFDIMLYNNKGEAYGAHVGLYLGNDKILHLSKDNEIPRVETHEAMRTQRKYGWFIGAKRILDKPISNNKA